MVLDQERERARAAVEAFEHAFELTPDLPDAYEGAGRAHMQLWDFSEDPAEKTARLTKAIERFREAVAWFPERKGAHVALIRALYTAGKPRETLAAIAAARERWPEDAQFRKRR